jgi:hypothetical protein
MNHITVRHSGDNVLRRFYCMRLLKEASLYFISLASLSHLSALLLLFFFFFFFEHVT